MKHKLIALGIVVALCMVAYCIDLIIAAQYTLEVISQTPEGIIPANGGIDESGQPYEVTLTLRLTKNGEPVKNTNIRAVKTGYGSLDAINKRTDDNGCVQFCYIPYKESIFRENEDVPIEFIEDSHSLLINVYVKIEYVIQIEGATKGE